MNININVKKNKKLKRSSLIFFAVFVFNSGLLANQNQYSAERYLGKYTELKDKGYLIERGIGVDISREPNRTAFAICKPYSAARPFDCVLIVTEILGSTSSGSAILRPPSEMLKVELQKGWRFLDTGDTGCISSKYFGAEIVAIGKWIDRKKPLYGGYASLIAKAWRVDYESLQFVEISPRDVSCGYDDDRN